MTRIAPKILIAEIAGFSSKFTSFIVTLVCY